MASKPTLPSTPALSFAFSQLTYREQFDYAQQLLAQQELFIRTTQHIKNQSRITDNIASADSICATTTEDADHIDTDRGIYGASSPQCSPYLHQAHTPVKTNPKPPQPITPTQQHCVPIQSTPLQSNPQLHTHPIQEEDSDGDIVQIPQLTTNVQVLNKHAQIILQRARQQRQYISTQQHHNNHPIILSPQSVSINHLASPSLHSTIPLSPQITPQITPQSQHLSHQLSSSSPYIPPSPSHSSHQQSSQPIITSASHLPPLFNKFPQSNHSTSSNQLQSTSESITISVRSNLPNNVRILLNWLITVVTVPEEHFSPYEPLCKRLFDDVFHPNSTRKPFLSTHSPIPQAVSNLPSNSFSPSSQQTSLFSPNLQQHSTSHLSHTNPTNPNSNTKQSTSTPNASFSKQNASFNHQSSSLHPTESQIIHTLVKQNKVSATEWEEEEVEDLFEFNKVDDLLIVTTANPTDPQNLYNHGQGAHNKQNGHHIMKISSNLSDVTYYNQPTSKHTKNDTKKASQNQNGHDGDFSDELDHLFDNLDTQPVPIPKVQHFSPPRSHLQRLPQGQQQQRSGDDSGILNNNSNNMSNWSVDSTNANASFSRRLLLHGPESGKKGSVFQLLAKAPSKKQKLLDETNRFVDDEAAQLDSALKNLSSTQNINDMNCVDMNQSSLINNSTINENTTSSANPPIANAPSNSQSHSPDTIEEQPFTLPPSFPITDEVVISAYRNQLPQISQTTSLSVIKKATGGKIVQYLDELGDLDSDEELEQIQRSQSSSSEFNGHSSSGLSQHSSLEPILISPSHQRHKNSFFKPTPAISPTPFNTTHLLQLSEDIPTLSIPNTPSKQQQIFRQEITINTSIEQLDPNDSFFVNSSHGSSQSINTNDQNGGRMDKWHNDDDSVSFSSSSASPPLKPAFQPATTTTTASKPVGSVPTGVQFVNGRWIRDPVQSSQNNGDESDPFDDDDDDDADVLDDIPDFDTPAYIASEKEPQTRSNDNTDITIQPQQLPPGVINMNKHIIPPNELEFFDDEFDADTSDGDLHLKLSLNTLGVQRKLTLGLCDDEATKMIDAMPDDLNMTTYNGKNKTILDIEDQNVLDGLTDDDDDDNIMKPSCNTTFGQVQLNPLSHQSPIVFAMNNPLSLQLPSTNHISSQLNQSSTQQSTSIGIRSTILAPIQDRGLVVANAEDEGFDEFLQHEHMGTFSPRNIHRVVDATDDLTSASLLDTPVSRQTRLNDIAGGSDQSSVPSFCLQVDSISQTDIIIPISSTDNDSNAPNEFNFGNNDNALNSNQISTLGSTGRNNNGTNSVSVSQSTGFLSPFHRPLPYPTLSAQQSITSIDMSTSSNPATKKTFSATQPHKLQRPQSQLGEVGSGASFHNTTNLLPIPGVNNNGSNSGTHQNNKSKLSSRAASAIFIDDLDDFDDDEDEEEEKKRLLLLKSKNVKNINNINSIDGSKSILNTSRPQLIQDNHAKKFLHELELPLQLFEAFSQTDHFNAIFFPTASPHVATSKRRGRSVSRIPVARTEND